MILQSKLATSIVVKKIVNFLFVFPGITLSYQLILIYHDIIADGPDFKPYLHFSFKKLNFFTCWGGGKFSQKKDIKAKHKQDNKEKNRTTYQFQNIKFRKQKKANI